MSYEGYEVLVCAKGHYDTADCHQTIGNPAQMLCHCGEPILHIGTVDETNCLPYTLDFMLIPKTPEVVQICQCCRNVSIKEEATFTFVKVEPYESKDGNYILKGD